MSITKPTRWADVPAAVRAALADLTAARKAAGELPVLSQLADAAGWRAGPINAFWGGPRPLANMLVGSALGGLGGYGVGRIAEKFLPPEYFEPGAIRRRAALLGAGLGGVPGLYQWYDNYSQNKGQDGPAGKALDAIVSPGGCNDDLQRMAGTAPTTRPVQNSRRQNPSSAADPAAPQKGTPDEVKVA
jgi:hypothetical protein